MVLSEPGCEILGLRPVTQVVRVVASGASRKQQLPTEL